MKRKKLYGIHFYGWTHVPFQFINTGLTVGRVKKPDLVSYLVERFLPKCKFNPIYGDIREEILNDEDQVVFSDWIRSEKNGKPQFFILQRPGEHVSLDTSGTTGTYFFIDGEQLRVPVSLFDIQVVKINKKKTKKRDKNPP